MPSCPAYSVAYRITTSGANARFKLHAVHHFKRFASSASSAPISSPSKTEKDLSLKPEPLTLLHKTRNLLPRVLGDARSGSQQNVEAEKMWDSVLSGAYEDLSVASERPAKLLVCGMDEWSGAQELVTALLADPLSSNAEQDDALYNRWSGHSSQKIQISYSAKSESIISSSLKISSGYLSQFPVPVELLELRSPAGSSSSPLSRTKEAFRPVLQNPAIFEADIPILVLNPLTTPLDALFETQLPTNTILVLTSSISQTELDVLIERRLSHVLTSGIRLNNIRVISADPAKAIQAVKTLQAQPNELSAIKRYQTDFVGSQISKLTNAVNTILSSEPSLKTIRKKMGLEHVQDALRWFTASVHHVRKELEEAFIDQTTLRETIEEHKAKAFEDIFTAHRESNKGFPDTVPAAIEQAERDMRQTMDKLTWWKMIWRVDEISSIVSAAVTRSWCHDLEKKLILHTGHLSVLQDQMSTTAFTLLSNHPNVSTAVLRNSLLQVERVPGYKLTADSLTRPIYLRRNQIIEYPTMRLHVTGQRVVLGMTGGILSGAGIGWAGWLGWLLGSGEGLLGFVGMDAGTAMGVGMLTAAASVRWAVGRWEKSKQRWWQDWARVGDGLDRDLKVQLQEAMQQQIMIMGETACEGISRLIRAREQELVLVASELKEVDRILDVIRGVVETPKP